MEFYNETLTDIPPLIIISDTEFIMCNLGDDANVWLKPKLMRNSSAFVIADPDGSLLKHHSKALTRNGYNIIVLNTSDFTKSAKYNPFAYIRNNADIAKLVTVLIKGTKGNGNPGDYSFIAAETNLLMALTSYVYSEAPEFERNFSALIKMLESMETRRGDTDFKNAVDFMFEDKEASGLDHLSVERYDYFNWIGTKKKQVIASCTARLSSLKTAEMCEFLSDDELGLDNLSSSKTALFITADGTAEDYKFIVPLMYSQLFNVLCYQTVL